MLFFIAFTSLALTAGLDIIEPIDPFRIYKPSMVTAMGWGLLALLLGLSLVIYRPWCHLLCPFGLVGWLFEKISIFKIRVDRAACIGCEACSRACPSSAMEAILSGKKPYQTVFPAAHASRPARRGRSACPRENGRCPQLMLLLAKRRGKPKKKETTSVVSFSLPIDLLDLFFYQRHIHKRLI